MTKKELVRCLKEINDDQEVYVNCSWDDAYPISLFFCKEQNKIIPYIKIDKTKLNHHRNFNIEDAYEKK